MWMRVSQYILHNLLPLEGIIMSAKLFKVNVEFWCCVAACTYKAVGNTKVEMDSTPEELAKHTYCLPHGQKTGKDLKMIDLTVGQLAGKAGGMAKWLNSDSAEEIEVVEAAPKAAAAVATVVTAPEKVAEKVNKKPQPKKVAVTKKPATQDDIRPSHSIMCWNDEGKCEKWARRNLPVNPRTITIDEFEKRCLCHEHADAHPQTSYDIDYTLNKVEDTLEGNGKFWDVWEARDKANADKPAKVIHKFVCHCGTKATHNTNVDPSTVTIDELKKASICGYHADMSDDNVYPLGLTIASAKRTAGGRWEDWEAREASNSTQPKETRRTRRKTPDQMEFAVKESTGNSKKKKAAQLAKKRAKSLEQASRQANPNVGSGDITQTGYGRGKKKGKAA
jgi:hypothetical protein